MKTNARSVLVCLVVLVVAIACRREAPEEPAPEPTPPPIEQVVEPAPEEPAPDPGPGAVPADEPEPLPAGTDSVTGLHGFGPARFGDDAESVRIAWGRPLVFAPEPTADAPCGYLVPDPEPSEGLRIRFMLDGDRFVRYDVLGEQYEAPGSARVGNTLDALEALYAGRHSVQPHKYIEGGHYVEVVEDGVESRLIFELDGNGVVTQWRAGLPPQVQYVEGCS